MIFGIKCVIIKYMKKYNIKITKISENLREGMFDQIYFGQYGKFQADILGDIETDTLLQENSRNGLK